MKRDTYAKMYTHLSLTDELWFSPLWSYNVNRGVAQKQIYALGRGQFPFMNLGVYLHYHSLFAFLTPLHIAMDRLFEKLCMPHSRGPALSIDEAKKLNFNDLLIKVRLIFLISKNVSSYTLPPILTSWRFVPFN